MNFNVFQPKLSEKNVACPHINFNILMFSTKDAIADKVSIVLGLFMCYLSRLSVTILSWDGRACKLVWRDPSVWATTKWGPNWSAFAGKLVPSPASRRRKRFTHLQLFVAKHVAISNLVWQRSHNDRRVMGPQLPPTVKVEPGLPNCKPYFSVLENSICQFSDYVSQIL